MKTEIMKINNIPAVLYGEKSQKGYLFVHGQGGNKEEAAAFAKIVVPAGFQVLGMDLPEHGERKDEPSSFDPWTVVPELQSIFQERAAHWSKISIRANSIGAYFSMLAFKKEPIHKALFVSPIVDMERLILDMMGWAGVTEEELKEKGEIATNFGQTLSWQYLCWVRKKPIFSWKAPTHILYAGHDNLTSRQTIINFSIAHNAEISIYEDGEHWFHTPKQCEILKSWESQNIQEI